MPPLMSSPKVSFKNSSEFLQFTVPQTSYSLFSIGHPSRHHSLSLIRRPAATSQFNRSSSFRRTTRPWQPHSPAFLPAEIQTLPAASGCTVGRQKRRPCPSRSFSSYLYGRACSSGLGLLHTDSCASLAASYALPATPGSKSTPSWLPPWTQTSVLRDRASSRLRAASRT